MTTCPHCVEPVQEDASVCPHCRRRIGPVPGARAGVGLAGLGLVAWWAGPQLAALGRQDWVIAVGALAVISALVIGPLMMLFGGHRRWRLIGLALVLGAVAGIGGVILWIQQPAAASQSAPSVSEHAATSHTGLLETDGQASRPSSTLAGMWGRARPRGFAGTTAWSPRSRT